MMGYVEISRAEINSFLRSAVILAMAKPEYINGGVRVRDATIIDGSLRLDIDNGDIVYLDFEHLVTRNTVEPRSAAAFYGAQCPSYPSCSGGCGLGCTHEIEANRASTAPRATKGGPTVTDPDRPYCKPDQSCCDFCCGN